MPKYIGHHKQLFDQKCLDILVDKVVVHDKTAIIKSSYAALAKTIQKIKMAA